jgi:hypothetical protein
MNFGHFFKLNNKKSDLSRGIAFYDYISFKDEQRNFPIYLTITYDSIDFRIHYYNEKTNLHLHNIILSLPLSENLDIKDGLTSSLAEGWKTEFPSKQNNDLYPLVDKHYDEDTLSYFNLDCFEKETADCNQRFIRKLILDFIFDLEQTKVFQTSPYYEHISVKLKENYFFSALAAKANFYYYRKLLEQELKNICSCYIEYYLNAEKQWAKAIRSPKAQANFNDYRDHWFDDPEKEMDAVYDKNFQKMNETVESFTADRSNEKFNDEIEKCRKLSSKWYMERFQLNRCGNKSAFESHFWHLRFLAAIATAWILTLIGSDLLPAYNDNTDSAGNVIDAFFDFNNRVNYMKVAGFYLLLFFISLIAISFQIKQKSRGVKKDDDTARWCRVFLWRPAFVVFICIFYSSCIGVVMGLFTDKYHICLNLDITTLSPFFCTGVALAVFIGIVLESVTDRKTTEEE